MDTSPKLMATTDRHSELIDFLTGSLFPKRLTGELVFWSDTVALVYEDDALINVDDMNNVDKQRLQNRMGILNFKEPDLMVFHNHLYLNNRYNTRKAGCPDLIVEVWSASNEMEHRDHKFNVYASSPTTEHWYMEQESDLVKCYLGTKRLPDQHLRQILTTQSGLEFDLRLLQTGEDASWNNFLEYGYKGDDNNGIQP